MPRFRLASLPILLALPLAALAEPSPELARSSAQGKMELTSFSRAQLTGSDGLRLLYAVATFESPEKGVEPTKMRVDDCAAFFKALGAVTPPVRVGADAWPLTREPGRLAMGDQVLVDDAKHWCVDSLEPLVTPDTKCSPGKVCLNDYVRFHVELLSVVGPFVSYETRAASTAGGKASHLTDWVSWNLATRAPATLLDVVEESELREVLGKHPWVQKTLGKDFLPTLATSDLVFTALQDHTEGARDFTRFAFVGYNPKKGLATVRIAYHQGVCALCPNEVTPLELVLKPKAEWKAWFEEAAKGRGFYVGTEKVQRSLYAGYELPKK
jgi:hypothetical protein